MPALVATSRVPRIRVMAGGHMVIALTILLGIAAAHSGQNLLHALTALLLAFQVVSGFRSYLVLRRLEVTVEAPAHLDAEDEGSIVVTIRNGKRRLAAVSLEVDAVVDDGGAVLAAPAWVGRVEPGAEARVRLPLRALARGVARVEGLRISSAYPCDLFRRTLRYETEEEVLVRPARRDVRPSSRAGGPAGEAPSAPPAVGDGEIRGVRPWRDGDAPRQVHWKSTARTGRLVVREEESRRRDPWIVVLAPAPEPGPALEEAVATAAALLRLAVRQGRLAVLLASGAASALEVRSRRTLEGALDALARFSPADAAVPGTRVRGHAFLLGPRAGAPSRAASVERGAVAVFARATARAPA